MTFEKPKGREVRVASEAWPTADLELRAEGDGMTFGGYAAVFDSDSEPMPFVERIAPGAFRKSLDGKRNIRMFLNHNEDNLLATTRAQTLTIAEDEKGLRVSAKLPDTSAGRDLAALLARGDVDSMSFGFQGVRDSWSEDGMKRTLTEARLFEVSPVTGWPAYTATSAFVRHLSEDIDVEPETIEDALRALTDTAALLTHEQHDLLMRAINTRTDRPYIGPELAAWKARLAEKGLKV